MLRETLEDRGTRGFKYVSALRRGLVCRAGGLEDRRDLAAEEVLDFPDLLAGREALRFFGEGMELSRSDKAGE